MLRYSSLGENLPYRVSVKNRVSRVEAYADSLPRGSIATMREEVGGVDSIELRTLFKNSETSQRTTGSCH